MIFNSKKRMRWALPFAMLGAVGCSKVQLPHLGKGITLHQAAGRSGSSTSENGSKASSNFEKGCQKIPGIDKVGQFSIEQYPALISFIKSVSPLISSNPSRITVAHATALRATNLAVFVALREANRNVEADFFKAQVNQRLKRRPNPAADLGRMLQTIEIEDRSPCASAYLSAFYTNFVTALDPMGSVVFGETHKLATADTLTAEAALPADLRDAPPIENKDGILQISIPRLEASTLLDKALTELEDGQKKGSYGAILFDLRSASGSSMEVLAKIQASSLKGWGGMPIVLWTDRTTRGIASLAAYFLAQRPNVLVIGVHEATYGYARKLVQQSTVLVEGLSPMTLVIGSELIPPPGMAGRSDGYQIKVKRDGKENRESSRGLDGNDGLVFTSDDALKRASDWKGEAQVGFSLLPESTAESTEGVPAQDGAVAPALNSEDVTGGAATVFGASPSGEGQDGGEGSTAQALSPPLPSDPPPAPLADGVTTF